MLDWKEIKGIRKGITYRGHKEEELTLKEIL